MKKCQNCDDEALPKEKYCKACRKAVLSNLRAVGYLGPKPLIGYTLRGPDHRENQHETKHGVYQ